MVIRARCRSVRRGRVELILATLVLWAGATAARAGQVTFQRLEEVAGNIRTVLRVTVLEVTTSQEKMRLEDGSEGPVLRAKWEYHCRVKETVFGAWDLEKGASVLLRHTLQVGMKYDEKGNTIAGVSYLTPHSGIETELRTGDEFLACLAFPGTETEPQTLYRAEPIDRQATVLAAIAEARAWALFRQKHEEQMKSVLVAGFDAKSGRLALLIDAEGRPVFLVDPAEGSIRTAKTHLVAPINHLYFDATHVILRFNDETPRPIRLNSFQ